jgi:RNA polymerase sigma-70 factor (ECF subfamily)
LFNFVGELLNKTKMQPEAFGPEIYQHEHFLRGLAFKLTRHAEDAEDLVQETFYKAIKNQSKYQEGTNLRGWLYTILKNTFINNYRKKKNQNTYADDSENQYVLGGMMANREDEADSPYEMANIIERIENVERTYLDAFMMYFNGYKYEEIADQMGIPLGTVKSRIFLARRKMMDQLRGIRGND